MLDLITINEGKKLQQQQLKKVILQPTDIKKFNGKVYGFVMAWRNVISKNADQARSPQKSYESPPFNVTCCRSHVYLEGLKSKKR